MCVYTGCLCWFGKHSLSNLYIEIQRGIIVFIMITKRISCFKKILRKWVIKLKIWNRKGRHNKHMALEEEWSIFSRNCSGLPSAVRYCFCLWGEMLRAQLLQKWLRVVRIHERMKVRLKSQNGVQVRTGNAAVSNLRAEHS